MAKPVFETNANIIMFGNGKDFSFSFGGTIEDIAKLLTVAAGGSEHFEQALNLAILQIREAKAAQNETVPD